MSERIVLPFGGGLDKETGIIAVRPGAFEDIRNVLLHQGKALVRPGFGSALTLLDDVGNAISHTVAGFALRSERVGIVVGYQDTTDKVFIYRIDAEGTTGELIGEWTHDLGGWGGTPPKVSMTESYGRVFMAHDTRLVSERAKTIYYDPIFGATPLNDLEGDFLGVGTHKIRFRSVERHLAYLTGLGYGDEDEDRPEILRVSVAGDPTLFQPNHYFIVGDRRDAALRAKSLPSGLVIFKETESHIMRGENRGNFGVFPLDELFGLLSSGLVASFGGIAVGWSAEGPRIWTGSGRSDEIAIPLDLGGLEPADLVAQGDSDRAFAYYVPGLRVVLFVFGQRVYALTVRVEGDWKWSYWELGFEAYCGFTLYSGSQATVAPTGFPEYSAWVGAGTYGDVTVVHHGQDGDETLEIWMKDTAAGAWYLAKSVVVSTSSSQVVRVPSLTPGTNYDLALRYRRGALYTDGYTSADPSTWPIISRGNVDTAIDPPTFVSALWERTSAIAEQITLTVTPAAGQEAQDIEVFRDAVSIGTITGPHVGNAVFVDTGVAGETYEAYTFVTNGSGGDSVPSDEEEVWAGPPDHPTFNYAQGTGPSYEVGFDFYDETMAVEVWDNYDNAGGLGSAALRFTVAAGLYNGASPSLVNVPASPLTIDIQMRHKLTSFTVDDFSPLTLGTFIRQIQIQDPWV